MAQLRAEIPLVDTEDSYCQQGGVLGVADSDRGYRHPAGHLHDRQQGIESFQVRQRHRHADNRQNRGGGQHSRQMRRAPRPGDNHPQPAFGGTLGVFQHVNGHSMGGNHPGFKGNLEICEDLRGGAHGFPVGIRTHDQANQRCLLVFHT